MRSTTFQFDIKIISDRRRVFSGIKGCVYDQLVEMLLIYSVVLYVRLYAHFITLRLKAHTR